MKYCFFGVIPVLLFIFPAKVSGYDYGISVSRGDTLLVFGDGTDPALATPESIENMMQAWAANGYTSVLWREISWLFGTVNHPRFVLNDQTRPLSMSGHWYMTDIAQAFDGIAIAKQAAADAGLDFWVWKEIWNDGTPPGPDPPYWPVGLRFLVEEHPEYQVVDGPQNPQYGVMEMAYPQARQQKIDECIELVTLHNVDKIMIVMRTEMALTMPYPAKGDTMGFNQPVVQAMQDIYGVNILVDPRFNVNYPTFDIYDPMVESWRELRGGYVTQFLRELRTAMDIIDPNIELGIYCNRGEYLGPPFGNMKQQWRTWVDEGLIDRILMGGHMGCASSDCGDGYLSDLMNGIGVLDYANVSDYIANSSHPEIKLIKAGADYDVNTDGSMDNSGSADKSFADSQRNAQIQQNLQEYGYIGFIEQDFDDWPTYEYSRANGGYGNSRYDPNINSSPGFWERFGDVNDGYAVIQDQVAYGGSGNAAKVIRENGTLSARRSVSDGYSVDDPIQTGYATLEFRVYIEDQDGGMTIYLENFNNGGIFDIGLRIAANTGRVAYRNVGSWIETDIYLNTEQWYKFKMKLDMENNLYSAFIGEQSEIQIVDQAAWTTTDFIDYIWFYPQGAYGSVSYIDDVYLRWNPDMYPNEPQCGDAIHPYPRGDINKDCRVDFKDFAELSKAWLVTTL